MRQSAHWPVRAAWSFASIQNTYEHPDAIEWRGQGWPPLTVQPISWVAQESSSKAHAQYHPPATISGKPGTNSGTETRIVDREARQGN